MTTALVNLSKLIKIFQSFTSTARETSKKGLVPLANNNVYQRPTPVKERFPAK